MSDFTSGFWGVYVAIITLVSILGCAILLFVMGKKRVPTQARKEGETGPGTTGHTWDGDLAEYNNPLPRWWMWLFYITIAFSLLYLALYPGLGTFRGVLGWTSAGAYATERTDFDERVKPLYARYLGMDVKAVAADSQAHAMGERLFLNYCAPCHGSDAGGSKGFPSLRDSDWLYGGSPEQIKESISNGRNGIMPAFGPTLGEDGVKNVAAYVRSLSGLPHDNLRSQLGKPVFAQNCAACHGPDGKGNVQLGAPNLTDEIWLYGGSEATIVETISKGRGAASDVTRMPAHKDRLDEGKIQLLTAYVWGLSNARAGGAR
ncbi:MAG TPA: cytochrome-c oxidase, cbb3-type subunit III [Casimicrobiaceae bacterium]